MNTAWRAALLGGMATLFLLPLLGCGGSGDEVDMQTMKPNQVAIKISGMAG